MMPFSLSEKFGVHFFHKVLNLPIRLGERAGDTPVLARGPRNIALHVGQGGRQVMRDGRLGFSTLA
jgi:hypothetical protein